MKTLQQTKHENERLKIEADNPRTYNEEELSAMKQANEVCERIGYSPLPWSYSGIDDYIMAKDQFGNRNVIARIEDGLGALNQTTMDANKAYIVKACNEYPKLVAQRDELLAAAKEARMAFTLDYHGCTKPKKALCDISPAASQAHNKIVLSIQNCET